MVGSTNTDPRVFRAMVINGEIDGVARISDRLDPDVFKVPIICAVLYDDIV